MSNPISFIRRVPPWAISLLIHLIILIVLALLLRTTVVVIRGADSDRTAEVGIELKSRVDGKTYYQSAEEFEASAAAQSQGNQSSQKESAADIASEESVPRWKTQGKAKLAVSERRGRADGSSMFSTDPGVWAAGRGLRWGWQNVS